MHFICSKSVDFYFVNFCNTFINFLFLSLSLSSFSVEKMAHYQLCELEDFLAADDGFKSIEIMESMLPQSEPTIQIPEEQIFQRSTIDASEKVVEGEITKLLRTAPGILPPVDRLPKSYKLPKMPKQPDFIPNDRFNKIPILLDEKYFKFGDEDDLNENVRAIVNNLNDCGGNDVIGNNNNNNKRSSRSDRMQASCSSNGSNQSSSSNEALVKRFQTVFCDDQDTSDEDNCNVLSSPDLSTQQNQMQQAQIKPAPTYYNARQIYEMKRGKKQ